MTLAEVVSELSTEPMSMQRNSACLAWISLIEEFLNFPCFSALEI